MFQDIYPHVYHNEFHNIQPSEEDFIIIFDSDKVLLKKTDENTYQLPRKKETEGEKYVYLFSIDENHYFMDESETYVDIEGYRYEFMQITRFIQPKELAFLLNTAYALRQWYQSHVYCGKCGSRTIRDEKERMIRCPNCHEMVYPTISPAVIVGVINKDKILMSQYRGRAVKHHALIAGFAESGETIEETVRREVKEEVGLKVKNLVYYKSQPWPYSSSLLLGFYCELDGSDAITLEEDELAMADWFTADQIEERNDGISLTREMIENFRLGRHPFAEKNNEED